MVVFASVRKTQEMCIRYYYLGLQRGATAEDMVEGFGPLEGPMMSCGGHVCVHACLAVSDSDSS